MPLTPEEPQIHEKAKGPRATPAAGRTAPTPRPVPGPRSAASPRPGHPGPGPARPAPSAQRPSPTAARKPAPPGKGDRPGPQIQLVAATPQGAVEAADEAVDLLLDSGRTPGDVLVLTTGGQHPWAEHELSFGESAYWAQGDAREDVFYAAADGIGRVGARPVVVVAVNGGSDEAAARALPAALAKASALLVVCGDPARIDKALGARA
ncbi:hypothetical protein [Streptomyces sp. NPDC048001]|uniref:hypothetical protein n=1 Tax=unclassified Streptomyces TaxID=2593676 RepID=UPI0037249FE5